MRQKWRAGGLERLRVVACAAGKADAGFELDYWSPDRLGER